MNFYDIIITLKRKTDMNVLHIELSTARFDIRIVPSMNDEFGMVDVLIHDKHDDEYFDVTITDAEAKSFVVKMYDGASVLSFLADKALV